MTSAVDLSLLADIVVGIALLIALIIGAKRGLLKSLISVAVIGVSLLGATLSASYLTDPVSQWIMPQIEKRLEPASLFDAVHLQVPNFLSGLAEKLQGAGQGFLLDRITELVRPVIYAAIYLITFLLLLVLLRLVGKLLRIMEKLPILKTCNKLGGAVLGLAGGAVIISVILWAAGRFNWLPPEVLENSYFAKYFTAGMWIHNAM